ncbi:MAG: MBL fold metallo-hydrolase [Mycobacteriaceae bacterium]|nr:MBL fold metallo-hydrolase [Mycobacteriaceae bacterium]
MFWLCRTCAVEHASRPEVCAICADERQWVPQSGQRWATLDELSAEGMRLELTDLEDNLLAVEAVPPFGIGQHSKLVCGPDGNVLWDPSGFVDDDGAAAVAARGALVAIVASHPHMFGAQVQWSRLLGGVPVYVNAADAEWVMRPDPVIQFWSGTLKLTPAVSVVQVGGHFPGSAVALWRDGAHGRGVLLAGDTVFPNPDGRTVGFLRSYPNRIPLSAAVVQRMAHTLQDLEFDRVYGLFTNAIDRDARRCVRYSADRHSAWVTGDYDHLT